MHKSILLIFFAMSCPQIDSAKILGVFQTPSLSHQVVFRALYSELVKRGHELVVITPDPIYRNKTAPEKLTEIDVGFLYEMIIDKNNPMWHKLKRGVIMDAHWMFVEPSPFLQTVAGIFNYTEVSKIIKNPNNKFDLILFESLSYLPLVLCDIFKAPAIMFSSFYGLPDNFATVGAISRHPILHPHVMRDKFNNLNLFEKIYEMYKEYEFYKLDQKLEKEADEYLRQQFGSVPPIRELKKYVQLFFANSHPLIDGNRPVPPAVVYLGAMHLQPIKELPEDLKSYLDNSKRGVIYVSLGTNVQTQNMDSEMVNAFVDAFEALPYDVLWKVDGGDLKRIPKNVKMQKWFPQRDLLGHPNIKLFITQGGLQSTDEAIEAGVPLVGIPFLADQWYNVKKYVELGIGVKVNALTITASDIIKAANTVLDDESYRENIRELCKIIKDQKETPIERAVWWTEYVLRHKKSRHLLSPAADMTWSEYLMADVVISLAIILFTVSLIALIFLNYALRLIGKFVSEILKLKKD